MIDPAVAILAFVTLQRLAELVLSNRNSRRLLANGAVEHGRGHYPAMIALHASWIAALWLLAPGRTPNLPLLLLFALLQVARIWVLATLGDRWTTRIIVLPQAPLVGGGPFRLFRHPNYMVVALEIAVLPLVFGLWQLALLFTVLNAAMLSVRIPAEDRALAAARRH